MPSYEASHEYDKRGHRNHPPMPAVPPMPAHVGNQQRHPPPVGNQQQFNRGGPGPGQGQGPGPRGGPPPPMPPHNYPPDVHKRGGVMNSAPPPYLLQQRGPPAPHPLGPPLQHQPHPDQHRNGPPPPPGGAFNAGHTVPPWPPWQPVVYPPPNRPPPQIGGGEWNRGMLQRNDRRDMPPRNERRDMPPRNNPPMPSSRLPLNPNLPPRPLAPLGTAPMDERYRVGGTGSGGYNDRRNEHPLVTDDAPDGPPGGVLNYG